MALSSKRMRILYDHQVFSLQDAGGASRYHYELIRNLQLVSAVDITALIGLNDSVMPFAKLSTPLVIPSEAEGSAVSPPHAGTRIVGRQTSIKPGMPRYVANEAISAMSAPFLGKFDIYHPTLYRALPWVRRHKIVVTHHDCTHERFPHLFRNAAAIVAAKRKLFAQADAILCVSASSQTDLLHYYDVAAEKTHVIHHGFSPLPLPKAAAAEAEPYLLYVGSRAGYKNFDLLLEAFAVSGLARSHRLLAVGGGSWSAAEQQKIATLQLLGRVDLLPQATEETLARTYRDAALFIYPSRYEGFGFPPLEAMSLGCPVLVNRTSSLPEVCGDAAFYFDTSDAVELGQTLVSVLADAPGLATRRQQGKQRVALYDWARCALETLDVYKTLQNG